MMAVALSRRRWLGLASGLGILAACDRMAGGGEGESMLTVVTLGDSILDCGHYNEHGIHPGALVVENDDRIFPEFRGRDLRSRGPVALEHRARDGATVTGLAAQARGLVVAGPAVAMVTIGGNDLLVGLLGERGDGIGRFAAALDDVLRTLPIRPVLLGNVYDPTFGDDSLNFTGVDPALARSNHRRINAMLAEVAGRYGTLVDLHAHFLTGDPSWLVRTIEPSPRGASEVRRCFLPALNVR
jgi:acyl-CoA thioesterase I